MDRIDIKAALERRGWSLRKLGMANGYAPYSAKKVLHSPWPKMERIVAEALGMYPWEIWPDRYPNGPTPRPDRRNKTQKQYHSTTGDTA